LLWDSSPAYAGVKMTNQAWGLNPKIMRAMKVVNVLLLSLLTSILFGSHFSSSLWAVAILGFIFVRGHRQFLGYLSFVTGLSLLFFPGYEKPFFTLQTPTVLNTITFYQSFQFDLSSLVFARFAALLVVVVLLKVFWNQAARPLWSIAGGILIAGLWLGLARISFQNQILHPLFFFSLAALFCRSLLSILIFRQFQPRQPFCLSKIVLIFPFFQTELPFWDQIALSRPPESEVDQFSYFYQICGLYLVFGFCRALKWFLFESGFTPFLNLNEVGYLAGLSRPSNRAEIWINFLFPPIYYIGTALWAKRNCFTLLLNVLGYRMINSFNQPWKAKSFSDFMSRMFYYYSRYLTYMLYVPLIQRTRSLRRFRPLDQLAIAFCAIFLFSMIFHLLTLYWSAIGVSLDLAYGIFKSFLVYSFCLSFFVCLSLVLERAAAWRKVLFLFRFPLYLFMYAIIFNFVTYFNNPLSVKLEILKALFVGL
jgi:hypothetical protein